MLGVNIMLPPPWVSQPDVATLMTQHQYAKVFLEDVNGQGLKTLSVNGHVIASIRESQIVTVRVDIYSLERDEPRQAEL